MTQPLISVVIPLYNKQSTIVRALESVLNQTFTQFEIIVVDDGSTDQSAEHVGNITDPRIRMVTQTNQGVSAARNNGVYEASAEYVAFLDADDCYQPDFLQHIANLIKQQPDAGMYCCRLAFVNEYSEYFAPKSTLPDNFSGELSRFIRVFNHDRGLIHPSSMAVKKAAFNRLEGFAPGKHVGEDVQLILQLALHFKVMHSSYCGATVFRDAENRTRDRKPGQLGYHLDFFLGNDGWKSNATDEQRKDVIRFCCHNALLHAAGALLNGQRALAWQYYHLVKSVNRLEATKIAVVASSPCWLLQYIKQVRNA